ncbi:putative spermidine/putrescine transport system substrate-binding protein [Tepidamorphus gemmatus]|uniref:Putative spermidine/putrescine transport system substrate-binding protein n=1 Tax=Tepidamorphus gemmatus TaxID=747076 RepID=A0A4R3LQ85_9HYPH|nr:PotD/PotF family extracellular solute-binding protein [Tepidamorphus gemmatus]TCT02724.1 putative spermidine/putrescine transport system substrate-binding protein [Tepidamorphus gemmatus]
MSNRKLPLTTPLSRRRFLAGTAAAGSLAGLSSLGLAGGALAQEPPKPAELIVRAWGGVWVDSLKAGVSDPFTARTGIAIRHDLTEDNEIQPKVWAAVAQNRVPPIHINWDTTANATKSALRGVTEDLSDLPGLDDLLDLAKPVGLEGYPIVNTYAYVYVLAYRDEAFPDGPPTSWTVMLDPKFKGRIALYNDGIGFQPPAQIAGGGSFADIPDNMDACWEFMRKIKAQNPLLGEDPDFTAWFQNGEIDLACTISSNAREAKKNGIAVSWTVPVEGAKVDTDGLWIPRGLPENELYWAKQYIAFALTKEAQQVWLDGLGLPGVYPGLTPPADLVGDPSYPVKPEDFERLLLVPPQVQVEHQSEWFAKFKEIMQS